MQSINQKLERPRNDWAKCLYILIDSYTAGTNMLSVLKDYDRNFWKFQTRLSDLLKYHSTNLKISKVPIPFHSKLSDKEGWYTQYTPIGEKSYMINLYNKINKQGLYRAHKPKDKK